MVKENNIMFPSIHPKYQTTTIIYHWLQLSITIFKSQLKLHWVLLSIIYTKLLSEKEIDPTNIENFYNLHLMESTSQGMVRWIKNWKTNIVNKWCDLYLWLMIVANYHTGNLKAQDETGLCYNASICKTV